MVGVGVPVDVPGNIFRRPRPLVDERQGVATRLRMATP
jgi:hypothetical protein